jgi:hypothetical protein
MENIRNEFIILQRSGFEEFLNFINRKSKDVIKLAYPDSKQNKEVFDEFFASPSRKGRLGARFAGCFAVELTDYVENPDDKHLSDLAAYIRENKEIAFVLFSATDGSGSAEKLAAQMDKLVGCRIGDMNSEGIVWQTSRKQSRRFGY